MKKITAIIFAAVLTIALCGCTGGNYPVTEGGIKLTKEPQKIVVLSGSIYSVLKDMGAGDMIVGAASGIAAENCTDIGTAQLPDINKISELGCDVVISNTGLYADDTERLKLKGIKTAVIPAASSVEELGAYYHSLAVLAFGNKDGEAVYELVYGNVTANLEQLKETEMKTAVILVDGGFAAASDSITGSILKAAGYINFTDIMSITQPSADAAIMLDPDVIFCPVGMKESIAANAKYAELKAVKGGQIFEVNIADIENQATNMIAAAIGMHNASYSFKSYIINSESLK